MSRPSELEPLAPDEWDPELETILDDMDGRPLNVHRLMAHNPSLLKAWWAFRNYSVAGGRLSERHRELVILRVAFRLRSWYEWASHVERGSKAGLSLSEIARVESGPSHADWAENEALLLQAVDDCIEGHAIRPATRAALERHFDDARIMDVIAIQGMYAILGTLIHTWGLSLDDFVHLPDGVSRPDWAT